VEADSEELGGLTELGLSLSTLRGGGQRIGPPIYFRVAAGRRHPKETEGLITINDKNGGKSTAMISRALEIRRITVSASFVVLALLIFAPQTWAQTSVGTVGSVNGNVTIVRAGKSIPTTAGTTLKVGDECE
jgi:hypothetical protein